MSLRRRKLNILLIILGVILGGWAVWLYRRPPLVLSPEVSEIPNQTNRVDTMAVLSIAERQSDSNGGDSVPTTSFSTTPDDRSVGDMAYTGTMEAQRSATEPKANGNIRKVRSSQFNDVDPRTIAASHPFSKEALKVLRGGLEEDDSVSRHKILSYCEHLRTSYTTRDIDFIRQVFSDNALIIVGHVVKTGEEKTQGNLGNERVRYSVRTKHEYLERLNRLFESGKEIDVKFSDFKIMRHPTLKCIYGVTLKQAYKSGNYQDDGYLFLLWDFRDKSMPMIHVRTWQPAKPVDKGEDELIEISDFNLE